jgi:integrase
VKKKDVVGYTDKKIYLLMEQREGDEYLGKLEGRRNALKPAWFWLTAMDTLNRTGMRQNQLLHIRLIDVDLDNSWINLRPEGPKTIRNIVYPLLQS